MVSGVPMPQALATCSIDLWGARRGLVEFGLLHPPASPGDAGPPAAGAQQLAVLWSARWSPGRRGRALCPDRVSLTVAQFDAVVTVFTAGLVLMAGLAVVPRRRVHVATNLVVALLSGDFAPARPHQRLSH
jgi:hypothetical protein